MPTKPVLAGRERYVVFAPPRRATPVRLLVTARALFHAFLASGGTKKEIPRTWDALAEASKALNADLWVETAKSGHARIIMDVSKAA